MEKKIESLSFEEAFAELDAVLAQIESGETTLEESVTLYERGRKLAMRCQALLDQAELKVQQLNQDNSLSPLS